ncbi:MAG: GNAT family N-acetyltransferase [Desulfobacula sp. RIFOXYA12_FULL_46_16]|nr:MAG: GNAT family N-acetyltransferase [Desulfobacula sp. RIFOXYA12_FULL_46_16]OGR57061.1 MAG: GNAT family N-acetyltransferase [Desulfobacula sp. RIFOXYB2_FULL_45_6]
MSEAFLGQVTVKPIISALPEDLKDLYTDAAWWDPSYDRDPGFLNHLAKESAVFVGAFYKKKMIGMGRALSDLVSDAYIQDVTVLKEYRGKGIGKIIIRTLVEELRKKGVDWIGLVAEPGTSAFYKELGFDVLKDHIPLKYKDS